VPLLPVRFLSIAELPNIARCSSPAISKSGPSFHSDTASCLQSEDQPRGSGLAAPERSQIPLLWGETEVRHTPANLFEFIPHPGNHPQ